MARNVIVAREDTSQLAALRVDRSKRVVEVDRHHDAGLGRRPGERACAGGGGRI